ncbi:bifunctional pyr operon transcriptional regulator/uracil phosphoribosyltransferase PyrR [Entomospira culicis]|uniref:Bifunctional pyr operon transcriptional regulator/uracil phosphoribosyltransferase PyrR n=1 Tax=Entomospira culicis TaxID=2719989 RepID=A0A968GEL1_9SPIO|nr:bifunctional pyr operon transcriptional regulator/uracil phosphoribosyltransferase PyrR [Entomospira culicis]NIZ18863.1 bifunctional pyr operon transcriptional regulator/uracil phosphoribosyltransferase PyrR [Entomospira culicis]NIZ69078.1 bifunctional pyr operon transcriptional regulator/uracil phosphoribosyltransferase PyrR [Entomospira culicis]WDI39293.1 bifunctional pyr operon transcriptional regulator/uracil phosphoribosyltransferase PyrR [Entomospira culicis]
MDADEVKTIVERMAIDLYLHVPAVENLVFIGIQSRGDKLAERLRILLHAKMQRDGIAGQLPLGILNVNFYRDDLGKNYDSPNVKAINIDFDITNKHVILIDDVFYTGRTVRAALDAIFTQGRPSKISMLTLVKRPGRELPVLPEFVGLDVAAQDNEYIKVKLKEVEGIDEVSIHPR